MMMGNNIVEVVAVSLLCGAPFVIGLAYIIISAIERTIKQGREAALKSMMVERGFSAAEIAHVIASSADTPPPSDAAPPMKPMKRAPSMEPF